MKKYFLFLFFTSLFLFGPPAKTANGGTQCQSENGSCTKATNCPTGEENIGAAGCGNNKICCVPIGGGGGGGNAPPIKDTTVCPIGGETLPLCNPPQGGDTCVGDEKYNGGECFGSDGSYCNYYPSSDSHYFFGCEFYSGSCDPSGGTYAHYFAKLGSGTCGGAIGGGGNACYECKKNCPVSNQYGTCGIGSDGQQKYTCKVACDEGPIDPAVCNGTSIGCGPLATDTCSVIRPLNVCHQNINKKGEVVNWYDLCCGCTSSAPAAPILLSPINGQNVDYSAVTLSWVISGGWGTGCPTNNNQYKIYVGTVNPPTTVVATVASSQTSYNFTGVQGTPVYYWRVGATNGGAETLSEVGSFVGFSGPWWQVKDADVLTNGNLTSGVPGGANTQFILNGLGGFPGVAIYGGTIADFSAGSGTGTVSSKGWLANAVTLSQKTFSYDYFAGLIPSDIVFNEIISTSVSGSTFTSGGVSSRGYYWYRFDGTTGATLNQNLTITSAANLGSRKVILLIKGANLNLNGNLNLTDGSGFFLAIVGGVPGGTPGAKGSIIVDPSVGASAVDLEGIYFADSQFKTGSAGVDADDQLNVRGAVAAYGGLVLERDLPDDSTTPAEFFEYGLDQLLLYPPSLSVRKIRWKEVAP